jgi:NAD(P)-dependent dehydrogenase (short-subunit alcohol dehydrogenase family)
MNTGLKNKHVLITGGSSGIGNTIVKTYLNEDAKVSATWYSNQPQKNSTPNLKWISLDLGQPQTIKKMIAEAEETFGPIQVLVHCAVAWPNNLKGDTEEVLSNALKINVEGTYLLTQTVLEKMISNGWGRIVLLSSGLAVDGMPGSALYCGIKSAMHGMIRGWMWDAGKAGVLVNGVLPGLTLTERVCKKVPVDVREQVRTQTPTQQLSLPEDIARMVLYLSSEANGNTTGSLIRVDGGL